MGVTYTHPQGTPNNGQRRSVIAGDGSARVRIYNTNLPGGTYYTGGVYIVGGEYSGASYDGSTLTLSGTTVAGYGGQPGTAGGQTAYWSANWGSGSWSGGYGGYVTWAYSAPGAPNAPSVSRSSNGTSLTATTGGGSGRITYYNVALNGVTGWNANGTTFSVGAHTTYTVISLAGNEDNSTQGGSTTSYGIPNSPGTPSVSPNTSVSGRIDVSWSAPSYVGGGILEYHVYRNGSYVNTTTSTSYADTGLTPGSSYSYTVYARNSTGWGPVSGTSSAATANGVPSTPNSFSVTNNTSVPGRIDLAWSAPSTVYTGVTSYKIYRNGSFFTSTTSTSYSNTGLSPNTSYSYYVTAVNSVGEGPATSTLSAVTNDVPSAPNSFSVTNNTSVPGRIDLAWSVPSTVYTGVTSYKIYRDGSFLTSTTSTSYANTGLNYNTTYSYYVTAVNSVGEGPATSTLSALTTGIPTSPRNFTATPLGTASDTGKIKLDWIAPDPATTYGTVTAYTLKRGTTQIYSGTNLTFTDTGLTAGTTYTYTVTVTNSSNLTSPEVSASAMAPGVPSAPRTFTATPNSTVAGRIDLAWIAPATTNGTITGYDVYRKLSTDASYPGTPTTVINGAATLSQTYTGLTLGATYNFKVVARNAFADSSGLRSAEATATAMAPTVPSAPLSVVATSNTSVSGRIDLSWVTPSATNGTITGYDIYYKLTSASSYPSTPNKTTAGTSTVTDITGLTVGSYYDFKIKARNSFADTSGNRSDFSDAATNALSPGLANAPVLSSAVPSLTKLGEVTVSWAAPTISAGTITQYYVYATISGQSPVLWASVSGATTSTTLTGLAQRQTYSFSVRAVNGWPTASPGTSPASNSTDARSPGAALAPTNLTASVPTNLSGTVNLSWTAPTDVGATGASIVGYGVYFSDNAVIVENTGSATTNYQVTGLVPNIEYYFYVRALNTISALPNNEDGIKSSTIGATPVGAPKAPLSPFITTSSSVAGRLTIGWSANPAETTSITGYNVFYADGTFVGTTTGTTLVVDNLSSDITYSFYIKARNLVTDTAGITGGDSSTTVSARPGSTSTQALPTTVTVTNNTNTVLTGQSTVTSLTSNTVSFSKSASDIPSASVPASASSVLTNNTNTIINGTYSVVSTPTTDKITYNRVGPNFSSTSTPSGTATNTTNAVFSGTHDITDINVDNKTISYNKTASTVTSRAVPLTPLATVSNTTSTVYNANNASITAVTEDTFSYAKTNANIEESIATGTVVNNTNRYIYNGTYTVTGVPAYNEFTYSTGDDVSRVNLAINPSMERVGTGTNILRTNHYTNPRMANSTAGWTILAPGATQTPDVNGTRIDFSDDVAPLEAFFYETSAMPIATGEYAVASIELTVPPGYPSLKLKSTLRSYGAGDAEVKTITVGTGQTVRLDSGVYLTSTTSSGVRNLIGATETVPAGARLVVRNAIFEKTNVLGEYFDGATADAKGWDFAWSGTADASKSYAKAQAVVVRKNQITNPGLEATSTGELVRTNIITNPSFEAALTGWTDSSTGMTSSRTTSQAYSGAASLQMISTLTNAYSISPAMSVSASNTYTASAWVKGTSGKLVGITIRELNSGGSTVGDTNSSNFTLNGSWQRISITRNLTSAAVSAQVLLIDRTASNAGQTFYADDILFEDSAFLGDYFSGATADGYGLNYAWTGTVDASTSTATTSSVYATNLATNPSGEAVQSGTVVLRTNLLDNPTPSETGSTDWAITSPGTGGVYSVTYEADGFTALTTTQPSDANFTIQIGATSGLTGRIPVEAGKTYTVSATVVSSINDVRSTGMVWYSATGVNLGVVYSTKRSLVANVPQRLWHTAVAPAGAVSATIVVVSSGGSGLSSQIRTVGSTISAKEALFEQTDQLREYFSGATTDALGWAYDWTGLANESSSVAKAAPITTRTNLLTNPSMESTQTGVLLATNLVTNPSMETTSGTVTVRTNLATNPSMETVSTGTTVLRTNLVTNPSFEVDTTGWVGSGSTISRTTSQNYLGTASLSVVASGQYGALFSSSNVPVTAGLIYTYSAWVKGEAGKNLVIEFDERNISGVRVGSSTASSFAMTGSWQRISVSRTMGATAVASQLIIFNPFLGAQTFYVDAAMLEASSTLNDYFDGSTTDALGWDYAWSGTANASASTASALSTIVRENLVTNPAMESVTSGSTVLRTNLYTDPSLTSTAGWSTGNVTGTFSVGSTSPLYGTTHLRFTNSAASTSTGFVSSGYLDASASTTYTTSMYVRSSRAVSIRVNTVPWTSAIGYNGGEVYGDTVTLVPNVWTRISTVITTRSDTAKISVRARLIDTSFFQTGDTLDVDGLLIEETNYLGPYFDGSTTDALGWDYAWSGTANASTSTAAASAVDVRTNLATNPSMESVTAGTVVMRRNLATNVLNGVNSTNIVATRMTLSLQSGFVRGTITDATVVNFAQRFSAASVPLGFPVTAGQTYTLSAYGRTTAAAAQMGLQIQWYQSDGTTLISATSNTPVTVNASTFTRFSYTLTAPTGAAYVMWYVGIPGTGARAIGDTVDVYGLLFEASSVMGDYFDGSTTDALGWDYAWSGTANASISTAASAAVTTRTNLITNPSMETSSTGELVRTNLVTNPSIEIDTTGWTASGATIARTTTQAYVGTAALQVTGNTSNGAVYDVSGVAASQTYTSSVWVKGTAGDTVQLELRERDSGGATVGTTSGTVTTLTGSWQRLTVTRTFGSTGVNARFIVRNISVTMAGPTYWDALMLEASPVASEYFDGSSPDTNGINYAWSGTANASTSTATTASLYATNLVTNPSMEAVTSGSDTTIRTNLVANPSFEVDIAGWTIPANGTIARVTTEGYVGAASLQAITTALDARATSANYSGATANATHTASAWVKGEAGKLLRIVIFEYTSADAQVGVTVGTDITMTGAWQHISLSRTFGATGVKGAVAVQNRTAGAHTFYVDAVMLEKSAESRSYFDGTYTEDHRLIQAWTGTVNNSASTALARGVSNRENFILNPNFETDTADWVVQGVGVTTSRDTGTFYVGTASLKVVTPGTVVGDEGVYKLNTVIPNLVAGTKISASAMVKAPLGALMKINVASQGTGAVTPVTNFVGTGDWQLVKVENGTLGTTRNPYVYIATRTSAQAITFYVDNVILELSPKVGPYFDGSYTDKPGWTTSWAGTTNASRSVATASSAVVYVNLALNPSAETVATGTVATRKNFALNPRCISGGSTYELGTRYNWTLSYSSTTLLPDIAPIATIARFTSVETGVLAGERGFDAYGNLDSTNPGTTGVWLGQPVNPGEVLTISEYVRMSQITSSNSSMLIVRFHNGAGAWVAAQDRSTFSALPNNNSIWTRLSKTVTVPVGARYMSISTRIGGDSVFTTSSVLDVTGLLIEKTSTVGQYFDGLTADYQGWSYAWDGTANSSTSSALSGATTVRENLVTNPSMETTTGSAIVVRTNHALDPNATALTRWGGIGSATGTATTDTTVFHSGTSSRKFAFTAATSSYGPAAHTTMTIATGETVSWSFWVRTSKAATIQPYWQIQASPYTGASGGSGVAVAANTWTKITGTYTFDATTSGLANYMFGFYGGQAWASGDFFYIDEILIEKVALSSLGDYFDGATAAGGDYTYAWAGTANDTASTQRGISVTNWTGNVATPMSSTVDEYIGTKSLMLHHAASASTGAYPTTRIAVTAGTSYTWSVYVKDINAGVQFNAIIEWYNAATGGTRVATTVGTATSINTSGWTRVSVTGVAPATATHVTPTIYAVSAPPAGSRTYMDAALFERTTSASSVGAYFDGSFGASGDYASVWSGTAHASTSLQRGAALENYSPYNSVAYMSKDWASSGGSSLRITPTGATNNDSFVGVGGDVGAFRLGMSAGNTYTATATIRLAAAQTGTLHDRARTIQFFYKDNLGNYQSTASTQAPNAAGTTRLSVTATIPAGATEAFVRLYNGASAGNGDVWWDEILVTPGVYSGEYFDGSVASTDSDFSNSWSGTPHLSTSLRRGVAASTVSYFNGVAIQSSEWSSSDTKSIRVVPSNQYTSSAGFFAVATAIGQTYTVKAKVRLASIQTGSLLSAARSILVYNDTITVMLASSTQAPNAVGVSEISATFTAINTTSNIIFYSGATAGNGDVWFDDFVVVAGRYAGSYFDGGVNPEGADASVAWTGTAHASTSTLSTSPVTDWTSILNAGVFRSSAQKYLGTYSAEVACTGYIAGQGVGLIARKTVVASGTYTASVWVLAESGKNVQIELEEWTTAGGYVGSTLGTSTAGTGAWMRLSVTRTFGATGTLAEINVKNVAAVAHNFYVDAALLERSFSLQDYFDGTLPPSGDFSYAWSATANASTSLQRAPQVVGLTGADCAAIQSFDWASTGAKSLRLVPTTQNPNSAGIVSISTVSGVTYTVKVKCRLSSALTGTLSSNSRKFLVYNDTITTLLGSSNVAPNASGVTELTATFTAVGTTSLVLMYNGAMAGNGDVWWDDLIVEKSATIQSYFDGSTGSYDAVLQRVWSGTPHASTSIIRGALPVAFGGPNNSSAVLTSERSYSGDRSTKVFYAYAGASGGVGLSYVVALTTGITYTASAWVYTPTGSNLPRFNIQSPGFTTLSGTPATLYDTWERISVTFTTNSTANYYIYILNTAAVTAGQFFYVDNFLLEKASAVLPYFDGATQPDQSGDTVVTWTGTAQASTSRQLGATVSGWTAALSNQSRSQYYSGSSSLACFSTAVQDNGPYHGITTSPSTTYTVSAWVKAEAGKLFRMRVLEYNGATYVGETSSGNITGTGSWQRVSVTRAFGASGNAARIHFENQTAGAHTFYVDAVLAEASPIVQDYFDGSIVSADADLTNSWSGTAHASTSNVTGVGVSNTSNTGNSVRVSSSQWSSSGSKSVRVIPTGISFSTWVSFAVTTTVGTVYTAKATVRLSAAQSGSLISIARSIGAYDSSYNFIAASNQAPNAAGATQVTVIFTATTTTTQILLLNGATAGNGDVWFDDLLVVQGNYTGEYFDGNTEDGNGLVLAWTGTANASTSTATSNELYATNRVLNPSMETVASGATTLRTNLVTNPNMEVVAWPGYGSGSGATLSTIQSYIGTQSTKTAPTLSGLKGITLGSFLPVIGGAKYTFSAWVYRESGSSTISPLIEWIDAGSTYISSSSSTAVTVPVGAWTRVFVTATAPANATQVALDVLFNAAVAGSDVMYVDAVLFEQTDQLRDYFDGATADALGWDYAWSGTANASSSTAKATPVAIRTNLSVNPRAIATAGGWSPNGAAQSVTKGITPPVAHPLGITTSARSNLNSGQTSPTALSMYNIDTLSNTGPQRSIGVWVLAMASGYKAYFYGQGASAVTLASGVWTYIQTTTAIAANTHMSLYVEKITGNADPADMIYVTGCVVEASTTAPSSYFDGSIGALEDGYYTTWSGTANASTSVQYGVAPQGWAISNGPGAFTSLSRGQDSDGTKFIRYNRPTNDTVGTWRVMSYAYSGMFDNLNIGTYVTLLLKVRASASTGLNFGVLRGDGIPGGNYGSSQTIGTSWTWVRYYVPLTTNNEANMWMYSGFPMGTGSYVDIAEALAVVGKYTGPYFTGAIDPDVDSTVAWTGTAHASTSTLSVTPVRNWIGTYGAVVHQSSLQTKDSSYAAKVYCNGDASVQGTQLFTRSSVSASTQYTASAWVLGESGKTIRIDLQELTSAGVLVGTTSSADTVATGSWQRISVSRTMGATASTANVAVSNVGATTHTFYLDAAMLERGPVASEYFDGDNPSLGDFEYLWTGTANQSTSIQRAVIPAGVGDAGMSSLEWSASGSRSIKVFPTTADNNSFANIANMLPAPSTLAGKVCTMVGTVRVPAALTGTLHGYSLKYRLWVNLSTGGTVDVPVSYTSTAGATAGVYEVRGTFTMPATATTWSFARIYNGASAGNGEVWWDNLVLTEGAYTGQTFSGDTADTDDFAFAWDGTPHASTSTFTVNPATNWTGVNGAVIYQTAVEKYIGTHSGQVSCSGSVGLQGARLISRSTVSASTLYYASAWVKGTVGKTLRIELQEYTATGTYIGGTASSNVTATGSWQRISVSRTMGSTGTRADVVISNVAATPHNFYVDAVMLEAASSLQNYFDGNYPASGDFSYTWNGTAEASTSQYQAPAVGSTSSTGAYAIQSSQWASNGTRSLRVISTTAATNSASVNFTPFITSGLEPGKTYTVKAKVYRAQAGARVGLLAYHGYVATTLTQNVSANIPTTVGTHSISITFTVGLTIEDARLLIFSNQVAGAADIWIDDFFIVEGEYTGDYFDGDTTGTGGAFPILYNWQGTPHNSSSIRDVGGNAPAGGAAILSPYGDAERVNSTAALEIQYRSGWLG